MVSVDEQHHIYRTNQGIKSYEMVGALIGEDFASFVDYFDHQHPPTSNPPPPPTNQHALEQGKKDTILNL